MMLHSTAGYVMPTILLIEDDPTINDTLRYNFEREGYGTLAAEDGVVGLELARSARPDLIILDVVLPRLDGFSLCRTLREESDVPIILLTGRQDEIDRIAGLELGADDYLTKPFSFGELLARVRAILRRVDRQLLTNREILQVDALRIDTGSRRVWRGDEEISLAQKEYDLLLCLVRNRGIALSRELLLERVWGYDFSGDSRTVDVHIRWLRQKIELDPARPVLLRTLRGVGYRFESEPA